MCPRHREYLDDADPEDIDNYHEDVEEEDSDLIRLCRCCEAEEADELRIALEDANIEYSFHQFDASHVTGSHGGLDDFYDGQVYFGEFYVSHPDLDDAMEIALNIMDDLHS